MLLPVLLLAGILSCTKQDPAPSVDNVSLSAAEVSLLIGEEIALRVTVTPAELSDLATWTSLAPGIARVSPDGVVTGVAAGVTSVVVSAGDKSAACRVTVRDPQPAVVPVSSLSLDRKSALLPCGSTLTLTATVRPPDATDPTVTWTSSDAAVATVQEGVVTGIAEGTATVTARAGDFSQTCLVTVIPAVQPASEIRYTAWVDKEITLGDAAGAGANIVSHIYSDGEGVITFDGPVTCIPGGLFAHGSGIKTLSLPASVREIADQAFLECSNMLSVTLQEGVTRIGDDAFRGCFSLREMMLPSTLESVGSFAFWGCGALASLTIPERVIRLDDFALYGCTALTSLTFLPDFPCELGFRALDETGDCPIYVPAASLGAYRGTASWQSYASRLQ